MNPLIRPFLRFVGEIHTRLSVAEATIHRWRTQCGAAEAQLQDARAEVEALRAWLKQEREGVDNLKAELSSAVRAANAAGEEHRNAEERLGSEMTQYQHQVMRNMGRQQAAALEVARRQAANSDLSADEAIRE